MVRSSNRMNVRWNEWEEERERGREERERERQGERNMRKTGSTIH